MSSIITLHATTMLLISMPTLFDQVLDVGVEVRHRAEVLSTTIPEDQQELNYKLLRPVIEDSGSLSPPSKGLRTSATPPLFPTPQAALIESQITPQKSQKDNYIYTMPSLDPFDFDDERLDNVLNAGVDAALPPNSAQRDRSISTNSKCMQYILANEVQQSIEQKQDLRQTETEDGDDESTSLDDILCDAQDNSFGKKPDFVMTSAKLGITKLVDMEDGQTAEITCVAWGESKGQGYWLLEDNYGHKHIVKYFSTGRCYKKWLGFVEGFDEDPIAWPDKSRKTLRVLTGEEDLDVVEDGELSDGPRAIRRDLRKKTWTQKHPYAVDKEVHAATRQGKVKRTSDIDAREAQRDKSLKRARPSMTPATPRRTPRGTRKKQRRSRSTTTNPSDQPELTPRNFLVHIKSRTTILTRLPPDDEPIPMFLSDVPDVKTLWDKTLSAWESDIYGTVKSMSIRFSWLGPEYNIKLKTGLTGSYEKMMEEVKDAPCWKDGSDKCSVDVLIIVA